MDAKGEATWHRKVVAGKLLRHVGYQQWELRVLIGSRLKPMQCEMLWRLCQAPELLVHSGTTANVPRTVLQSLLMGISTQNLWKLTETLQNFCAELLQLGVPEGNLHRFYEKALRIMLVRHDVRLYVTISDELRLTRWE